MVRTFSKSLVVNNSRDIEPVPEEYDYDGNLVGLGGGPFYTGHIGITNDDGHVINSLKTILQNFMKLIPPTLSGPEKSKILLRSFANIKFQITEAHTKYCPGCIFYFDTAADPYGEQQQQQFGHWMNKIIESSKLVCSTQSTELKDDVKKTQEQLSALSLKIDDTKILQDHGKKIEELMQANIGRTENFGNGMKEISGNIVEMKIKLYEVILALKKKIPK